MLMVDAIETFLHRSTAVLDNKMTRAKDLRLLSEYAYQVPPTPCVTCTPHIWMPCHSNVLARPLWSHRAHFFANYTPLTRRGQSTLRCAQRFWWVSSRTMD
jgi:hypothetical protein